MFLRVSPIVCFQPNFDLLFYSKYCNNPNFMCKKRTKLPMILYKFQNKNYTYRFVVKTFPKSSRILNGTNGVRIVWAANCIVIAFVHVLLGHYCRRIDCLNGIRVLFAIVLKSCCLLIVIQSFLCNLATSGDRKRSSGLCSFIRVDAVLSHEIDAVMCTPRFVRLCTLPLMQIDLLIYMSICLSIITCAGWTVQGSNYIFKVTV